MNQKIRFFGGLVLGKEFLKNNLCFAVETPHYLPRRFFYHNASIKPLDTKNDDRTQQCPGHMM